MKRRAVGVLIAASILVTSGCSPAPTTTEEPLTQQQAERLAIVRLQNLTAGQREITVEVDGEQAVTLTGWVDYERHVGYGAVTDTETGASLGLVNWTLGAIAVREQAVDGPELPAPADGWAAAALDPSVSAFTAALAIIVNLGSDRPENPQLLAQSDARWLRTDTVENMAVDVMRGPSPATTNSPSATPSRLVYWVNAKGLLLALDVGTGGTADATHALFTDGELVELPDFTAQTDG